MENAANLKEVKQWRQEKIILHWWEEEEEWGTEVKDTNSLIYSNPELMFMWAELIVDTCRQQSALKEVTKATFIDRPPPETAVSNQTPIESYAHTHDHSPSSTSIPRQRAEGK